MLKVKVCSSSPPTLLEKNESKDGSLSDEKLWGSDGETFSCDTRKRKTREFYERVRKEFDEEQRRNSDEKRSLEEDVNLR